VNKLLQLFLLIKNTLNLVATFLQPKTHESY
jgi:hypothetical protein